MDRSDIIIIGGGPGGYETAIEAAARGLKVTLFERDALGGTCLNRGCIPTKALCRSAEVLATVAEAAAYGVDTSGVKPDYARAHARMEEVVAMLRDGVKASLSAVTIVNAEARLTAENTVEADGLIYEASRIIIATGSRPAPLPIPGADLAIDSDTLLKLTELPASMVIIGGGVIGMEFASVLNTFGVDVTVVEYCKEILPPFDPDIAKRLRSQLSRRGIKFILSAAVTAINPCDGGKAVTYTGKKGEASVTAETVLMATGRHPVMPEGLEEAGVEFTPKGIWTDDRMMTSTEGIYAIGDVNGRCMLAHAATAQGRVALGDNINLDIVPSAVFTRPEAAMVGLTQAQAIERYESVETRTVQYGTSGKAVAMGEAVGVVKMLMLPESRKIVGCSILGAHASDLIGEVALAMNAGLSADAVADTIHAHPTLGELVMNACKDA